MLQMGAKTSYARIVLVETWSRLENEAIALDGSGTIVKAIANYTSYTIQLQSAMDLGNVQFMRQAFDVGHAGCQRALE